MVAARSKEELLALARGRAAVGADTVVFLQGYDETAWDAPTLPSLGELDAACDRPLVIRRADGHLALGNSAALTFAQALDADGCERDARGSPPGG